MRAAKRFGSERGRDPDMDIVLASSNHGKLAELRTLLEPAGLRVVPQDALGRTAAELSRTEKNAVSHRGQALSQPLHRLFRE